MRLVVLERDGVINRWRAEGLRSPQDWQPLPGSLGALARLHFAHFHVVVVNNEPGIGEGTLSAGDLTRIHAKMVSEVEAAGGRLDAMLYCPHRPDEGCPCRLPAPGLLLELQRRLEMDLAETTMISDSLEGIQAALTLNMRPILVLSGQAGGVGNRVIESLVGVEIQPDLAAAVGALLARPEAQH